MLTESRPAESVVAVASTTLTVRSWRPTNSTSYCVGLSTYAPDPVAQTMSTLLFGGRPSPESVKEVPTVPWSGVDLSRPSPCGAGWAGAAIGPGRPGTPLIAGGGITLGS